jgi:hypothetical protein
MTFKRNTDVLTTATTSGELNMVDANVGRSSLYVHVTGDANYTVQHTVDGKNWTNHEFLDGATGTQDGNYVLPVAAIRLVVNSITTGSAQLTVLGV